jgi:hypothetical protein
MWKSFRKISDARGVGARSHRANGASERSGRGIQAERLEDRLLFAAGLVAAYAFDEGAGTTAVDASGSGNTGTVSGAIYVAGGKNGGALSFDGINDRVDIADAASLDLTTGMTLEAWVNPSAATGYRTVLMKDVPGELSYSLYSSGSGSTDGKPNAWVRINTTSSGTSGTTALPLNTWNFLAATYDGGNLTLYVNGAQVATKAVTGTLRTSDNPLHVGGNPIWGEYFAGLIDDVRVYNRALSVAEMQADMTTPVGGPAESVPPSVSVTAPLGGTSVSGTVSVTASATDNVGVAGVQFLLDGAPLGTEDTAAPYSVSWNSEGSALGAHAITAVARDAAGNRTTSAPVAVSVIDSAAPTVSITAPVGGSTVSGAVTISASAADNRGIAGVQFFLNGSPLGAEDTAAPYSVNWDSSTVPFGTYTISAVARDASGNQATSGAVNVTADNRPDVTPPSVSLTAPASGSSVAGQVVISAAASDNVAVAGVQFLLNGNPFGAEDTSAPYSISWDTLSVGNGTYTLSARARDVAGNVANAAPLGVVVSNVAAPPPSGLVAAFSFDEGTGTTAADASGNGNGGSLANATWSATGRSGGALSFNGTNSWVTVADSSILHLTTGMTLEAWVNPRALGGFSTAIIKERTNGLAYVLYAADGSSRPPSAYVNTGATDQRALGTTAVPLNTWSHLAATYDGTNLVLYVNGVQAGIRAVSGSLVSSTGALRIGGNSVWGEWFNGLIDDVRVYNRALTSSEVNSDMGRPVGPPPPPDATAPTVAITAPAGGATLSGAASLAASASDNVAVAGVQFKVNGVNLGAEDVTAPYGVAWDTTAYPNGAYQLTAVARDAAGNTATSTTVSVSVNNTDIIAPTVALATPSDNSTVSGASVTLSANASDNIGVVGVQFLLDGAAIGAEDTSAPYSISWDSRAAGNGPHTLTARARDAAGNTATSAARTLNVSNATSDPAIVGQWGGIINTPIVDMHTALLKNGKILMWDGGPACIGATSVTVWDLATNTFTPMPSETEPHVRDLFCSAPTVLADGRVLVVGGHECDSNGYIGVTMANMFDPDAGTWTRLSDMAFRRWYPSVTTLPDGRALVTAGSDVNTTSYIPIPEIYNPLTNSFTQLTSANQVIPNYPFMFVLPDGRVLAAGSDESPMATYALNLTTQTWSVVDPTVLDAGSAVMYAPGRILKSGASYLSPPADNGGSKPSSPNTYVLDMTQPAPAWQQTTPMAYPRTHHNLTVLPDGTVLATGGSTDIGGVNEATGVLAAELWSPSTKTWTTMSSEQIPRLYHSTALLLPDGRVLVAGSGHNYYNNVAQFNAEIYSPAYLFKGARPTVSSSPATANYNSSFFVGTPDAADIASVSLIRNGAVTHSFNMDQRLVPLTFQQTAGGLTVQAPSSANLAPPGTYMLFIVNSKGVPSVAPFVRLPAAYEDTTPPTAPANAAAVGGVGTVSLSWSAASDNVAVARYNLYRSLTPGFTPSAANRVAQVTSLSYVDAGMPAGTYYYLVTAEDAAGNVGPASNQASATTTTDATAPTVSVTSPSTGATLAGVVTLAAAASDDVGVAGVQFLLDGTPVGAEDTAAPYTLDWNSTSVVNGAHTISARARDAAGNTTTSAGVGVSVSNTAPTGLVAYYRFDEGSGATALDASGRANNGTIVGASWTATGKYGSALSFNGSSSIVNVADASSLDLTTGMTLEAWVNPSASSGYRTVVMKDIPGELSYALYGSDGSRPNAWGRVGSTSTGVLGTGAVPLNVWTHLAVTYNGSSLVLYVNGSQAATKALSGSLVTSNSPLHIGGNAVWGEYFAGLIDDVRVYNRALSASEIQTDMNGPATPPPPLPDSQTHSLSGTVTPTAGGAGATLSLSGATTATVTADASGNYSFAGLADGTYTVVPSNSGYVFTPPSLTVSVAGGNVGGVNFAATAVPTTPGQPISLVQKAVNGNESATASMTVSLPSVRAGDFLIVTGTCARPSNTLTISDSQGNVFNIAAGPIVDPAQNVAMYVWYVTSAVGGADTFTITPATTSALEIHVSEWTGIAKSSPVDQVSFATGTGSAVSSGSKVTTANGELIFGYGWVARTASAGSGFTALSLVNGDLDEYRIQSAAGAVDATFTQSSSAWLAAMITFRPEPITQTQSAMAASTALPSESSAGQGTQSVTATVLQERTQPQRRRRLATPLDPLA